MIAVHRVSLDRRFYAPLLSGATVFFLLSHAATIIFAFLIAYYTHGLWVKEASYREQPKVEYTHTCAVKLQGRRASTNTPFELVYNTLPRMNDMAEEHVRIPTIRVSEEQRNMDKLSDTIKLDLEFPVDQDEGITHVQGIFVFQYELKNRVRLSMETPIMLDYGAGVPGSGLLVEGQMRLKMQNPLPVRSQVRGADLQALLPRTERLSAAELTFQSLVSKAMQRNESTVLDPALSSWTMAAGGCTPGCTFLLSLTLHVPNEKVYYVPTFVEVCKVSWIQFLATVVFLRIFIKPLLDFITEHQIIQTLPRDPRKCEKLM
eukprot:Tamp_18919.p1 GENE.Tamp_18919~~Tamp_18919.p1  ORF type:complete len:333 (+),score=74.06 Tamp_18919:48-1001(+)